MKQWPTLNLQNRDCMELLAETPDKYYDLAIVDPPYGIGGHQEIGLGDTKSNRVRKESKWKGSQWDEERPSKRYFEELIRVSENQIIWGGNYFADLLPQSYKWLVWDKMQRVNQSDCELAYTSFEGALRIFQFHCSKLQGFMNPNRFHPTEKPIALYKWLLANYAKPNDKILDTHLGSGSIAIACLDMGFELTGTELDPDYFEAMKKRINTHMAQAQMF